MIRVMICTVLFVAACSGGRETSYDQTQQTRAYINIFRETEDAPPALPALTPDFIAGLTTPTLEAVVERFGQVALLVPYSDRRDSRAGALRVWRAVDGTQLIFRDGVLIASRGLGHDLGSTLADVMVRAIQSRMAVSGPHRLYVKTGEHGVTSVSLNCTARVVGTEQIEGVTQSYDAIHVQAICSGDVAGITYDYWVDPVDSTVWQSRQWAGPYLGYIRTRLLKK